MFHYSFASIIKFSCGFKRNKTFVAAASIVNVFSNAKVELMRAAAAPSPFYLCDTNDDQRKGIRRIIRESNLRLPTT